MQVAEGGFVLRIKVMLGNAGAEAIVERLDPLNGKATEILRIRRKNAASGPRDG